MQAIEEAEPWPFRPFSLLIDSDRAGPRATSSSRPISMGRDRLCRHLEVRCQREVDASDRGLNAERGTPNFDV